VDVRGVSLDRESRTTVGNNVFCFNGFNRFTWFNIDRIAKNDRCLIKAIKTENITHKRNMT